MYYLSIAQQQQQQYQNRNPEHKHISSFFYLFSSRKCDFKENKKIYVHEKYVLRVRAQNIILCFHSHVMCVYVHLPQQYTDWSDAAFLNFTAYEK